MSQQGEKPAAREDDWWRRLYDESAPDTGASRAGDSLDERFDSASGTVASEEGAAYGTPEAVPEPGEPPRPEAPSAVTRTADAAPGAVARDPWEPPTGAGARAPWEAPAGAGARAPWEPLTGPAQPRTFPGPAPQPPPPAPDPEPPAFADPRVDGGLPDAESAASPPPGQPIADGQAADVRAADESGATSADERRAEEGPAAPPPPAAHVGVRPPTYDAEPTALPATDPSELDRLVPDTVLDGATYGTYTLRAASVRGDSARFRGEPRRDALLTARFGSGENALVLVAVAGASRGAEGAQTASADACRWIGEAVGRSHVRLSDDIRAGRRADLKSGLHRLTDRAFGKLRARAAELGLEPDAYTASLRCLLLSADPGCRTRVFFGIGGGGLFRLRDGNWHDLEPALPPPAALSGEPVVGFGSAASGSGPAGDRLTMDLGIATGPAPYVEDPLPPPAEPFRFRASVARPGDTLLLCGAGLAEPLREEPELAGELAARWSPVAAPGLGAFLADTQIRVKGYAEDRTAVGVWEA
ncbi:protein phosphatase 2C domain-containing protein [Streptomyces sp. NPDC019224]|uniref:protein phosphatase 2C domain-containing protein n=1 Tax=Streptomyces sp. NPDC019224 TaxID=3154484 RepID=UPI0033D3D7FD